jgi:hypothetical protein
MDSHSIAVTRARMSEAVPISSAARDWMKAGEGWRGSSENTEGKLGRAGTAVSKLILHLTIAAHVSGPEVLEAAKPGISESH